MQRASTTAILRRTGPYVAVWVFAVLIIAFTPLKNVWHQADFWFLQVPLKLGDGLTLDRGLSIVDLDVDSDTEVPKLRAHEVAFLDAINAAAGVAAVPKPRGAAPASCAASAVHTGAPAGADRTGAHAKPQAIVFDLAFLKVNSVAAPDCEAPLIAELHAAALAGIKIFGAVDLENPNSGGSISGILSLDPNYELNHDQRIYAEFTGKGHTEFSADVDRPDTPLVYYPKVVIIPALGDGKAGGTVPCALPIVIVGQDEDQCLPLVNMSQQEEVDNVIVPLGAAGLFDRARKTYEQAAATPGALDGQIVLVGDEKIDFSAGDPRSKFEMLAWATSQSIAALHARPYPRVLVDVTIMLALALGGSALALAAFVYVFTLRNGKPFRVATAVAGSVAVPALAIAAVEASFLAHQELFSQIAFPVLAVLTTTGVCLSAAISAIRRDLFVLSLQEHHTAVAERYDVFISYARPPENAAWVEEHVLGPLSRARMPDGKPLRVFFDRQSIKVGFGWYTTIVESIYGSRFFLPVYSEGYFDRPFCRDEMDIAMLRQVELGTFVLPIARVVTGIPDRYVRTQFIDVTREPAFMDAIIATITATHPSEASVETDSNGAHHNGDDRQSDGASRSPAVP